LLSPLVRTATTALIDDKMRLAFGYKKPQAWIIQTFYLLLFLRKKIIRFFDFEKSPKLLENSLNRTYPKHDYLYRRDRTQEIGEERKGTKCMIACFIDKVGGYS